MSSGRSSLVLILRHLHATTVHVPFYVCDAVVHAVRQCGVALEYYALGPDLLPVEYRSPREGHVLLLVNYFGVKGEELLRLTNGCFRNIILDNSQAFFDRPPGAVWSFNSARKFFGVPDGSYVSGPEPLPKPARRNASVSLAHLVSRLEGRTEQMYEEYLEHERRVTADPLGMSFLTERVLGTVDYAFVRRTRCENFAVYRRLLDGRNLLDVRHGDLEVPLCYPLLLDREVSRARLAEHGVFVPIFWPDVLRRHESGFEFERTLSRNLLPLPVDHRYGEKDVTRVLHVLETVGAL